MLPSKALPVKFRAQDTTHHESKAVLWDLGGFLTTRYVSNGSTQESEDGPGTAHRSSVIKGLGVEETAPIAER